MTGKIRRIFADKKFGFIVPDGGGDDIFFHATASSPGTFEALRVGDRVDYAEVWDEQRGKVRGIQLRCMPR